MANFDVQILDLINTPEFDGSTSAQQTAMDGWATDAVKELINMMPYEMQLETSSITKLYIGNTDTFMDLDAPGKVLHVTRENADSGYFVECRRIPPAMSGSILDSSSLHYINSTTPTDPVYWIESDSGTDPRLHVYPTPTANQPAKVYHVAFPTLGSTTGVINVSEGDAIVNFPDELYYLMNLYVAIKIAESLMISEEDIELFAPIVQTLKQDYVQGLQASGLAGAQPQQGA